MLTFSAKQHRLNRIVLGVNSFIVEASEGQTIDDVDKLIEEWKKEEGYNEFRKASLEIDVEIKRGFIIPPNWSLWSYDNEKNPVDLLTGVDGNISLSNFMRRHGFGYQLVGKGQHMFSKQYFQG